MARNFLDLIEKKWSFGKFVCVGLDTDPKKMALPHGGPSMSLHLDMLDFNKAIVDATYDLVCAYKPQTAFYEAQGHNGLLMLMQTVEYINRVAPHVPVILDAKRNDIGNTAEQYANAVFDYVGVDGVTLNGYLGIGALEPFFRRREKLCIVLCRTSNKEASEFQDLIVHRPGRQPCPLYEDVAYRVSEYWSDKGQFALVVGATAPVEAERIRRIAPNLPFLIPGVGAQGGDVEAVVDSCRDENGYGMIINSSRGIIYASKGPDFAAAARNETIKLDKEIKSHL